MANKPLQSIKFPGLDDTYTVPVVDSTLTQSGGAADAKKVGDEITQIKSDLSAKSDNINLFTGTNVVDDTRLNNTGGLITGETGYFTSDYFDVVPGIKYIRNVSTENIYHRVAYFNESKKHIATYTTQITTAPDNAKYARFCAVSSEKATYAFYAYESAKDTVARGEINVINNDITDLRAISDHVSFMYESPNKFNLTDSATVLPNKVINASGNIVDSTTDTVLLIRVNGIDGNAYQLYAPNSDNTKILAQSTRFTMLNSNMDRIGMIVNNQTTPAVITSNDCVYLACYIGNSKFGNGENIMILANAYNTSLDIFGYLPYGSTIKQKTEWTNKKWSAYGDSITAISNAYKGFAYAGWARYVNEHNGINVFYGRGIGSQSFEWKTGGGSVCFIEADGDLNSRDDNYTKDNYTGTIPSGCAAVRGAFCSWDRITHMFPASIKDTIDMVFVMGGTNDIYDDTDLAWVANDTTDPEWADSDYYDTYGGDYNITTIRGGVASTIMKLQAWMPNALIVIGTPLNGNTNQSGAVTPGTFADEYQKSKAIKDVANIFGCPVIDVFAECGINVLNSPTYITDGTHPYNLEGQKMLARSVTSGLSKIMPRF